jgi:hypothetical protein
MYVFGHSDCKIAIESDSEREAFISGQSVHLRSDGGFPIFSNVRLRPVTCQEGGTIARKGHTLVDTSTPRHLADTSQPIGLGALVPWCLGAWSAADRLTS